MKTEKKPKGLVELALSLQGLAAMKLGVGLETELAALRGLAAAVAVDLAANTGDYTRTERALASLHDLPDFDADRDWSGGAIVLLDGKSCECRRANSRRGWADVLVEPIRMEDGVPVCVRVFGDVTIKVGP